MYIASDNHSDISGCIYQYNDLIVLNPVNAQILKEASLHISIYVERGMTSLTIFFVQCAIVLGSVIREQQSKTISTHADIEH